jgi:cell wall-associated NlpC family hydrolase
VPLPWAPTSLLSDVDEWSSANTANRAMTDLATMGQRLMQPAGQQVRQVVEQALPAPMPQPAPAPVVPSDVGVADESSAQRPRFSLGKLEDWISPTRPAPAPVPVSQPTEPATPPMSAPAETKPTGMFSLPSLESFLGRPSPTAAPTGAPGAPATQPPAPGPAPAASGDLREYARAQAARYGLDPGIFERQIQQESGFNPKAVSPAGAQGIAQFMPATAKGVGLTDPFDPYAALDAAARHMADNLRNNGGDYARALAAYNAGQGAVNTHGGVPPFAETQRYVQTILGAERPTATAAPAPAATAPPAARQPSNPAPGVDVRGLTEAYKGVPYTFGGPGGRGQGVGAPTDCSGFVSAVWKGQYGLDLPAHTDAAYTRLKQLGGAEISADQARPGDVVFYMGAGTGGAITHHMGVVSGPGRVLDMSVSGGSGVKERPIGHGGQYVIIRDPRLNPGVPSSAAPPPPIVPTGLAEATGGRPVPQRTVNAASEQPRPLNPVARAVAPPAPVELPYDARQVDEGPRELAPTARTLSAPAGAPPEAPGYDTVPPLPGMRFPIDARPAPRYDAEGIDITNRPLTPDPYGPPQQGGLPESRWPQLDIPSGTMLRAGPAAPVVHDNVLAAFRSANGRDPGPTELAELHALGYGVA